LFDGEESKETPSVDCGAGPHTKDNGPPEEARIAYRREAEADRRRDTAKGIQHRSVARFAGLVLRSLVRVKATQGVDRTSTGRVCFDARVKSSGPFCKRSGVCRADAVARLVGIEVA
jgi:hypothetical protein